MVLVDLHSNQSLMGLRSTQDDVQFSGSAQGAVVGHTGSPNPNVDYDAPPGSGLLYNKQGGRRKRVNRRKSRKSRKGRKTRKSRKGRKSRKSRKQHASLRRRTRKGGNYVSSNPSSVNYLLGRSAGHPEFSGGVHSGINAPHKLGAGIQHPPAQKGAGGASLYPSQFGNTYYSTSMDNTAALRGSYPEVVGKTHGCQGGGKRRSRKMRKSRKSKRVNRRKSKRMNRRKPHKSRRRRHGRNKKGGYHQYLNGSARSFGYVTNGKLQPHQSALAGHGLMGAYKMGGYGFKGNYNHFTGKNT